MYIPHFIQLQILSHNYDNNIIAKVVKGGCKIMKVHNVLTNYVLDGGGIAN